MDRKSWIVICFLTALVVACAVPLPPVEDQAKPPQTVTPVIIPVEEAKSHSLVPIISKEANKDEELFIQAMHQLAGPFNSEAVAAARQTLESLLSNYPQSKWTDAARAIIRLIAELDTYRRRLPIEQGMVQKLATDKNRTLQEIEQLKKELRLLSEKYQVDLTGLQQENEQLKKDLQLLKNLEIQLDRREKMLR